MTPTPELNKALAAFQAELPHVDVTECPEHGNTLIRYGDVTACCVKNCGYEVPA